MDILKRIFTQDKTKAFEEIIKIYKEKGFCLVNYLYFANLVSNGIIGNKKLNNNFLDSLEIGDFLLPDGIALNLYYKKIYGNTLSNLNGTDFSEYLLNNLDKNSYNLAFYGASSEVIKKASLNIEKKYGVKIFYFQDGYSEFDFSKLDNMPNNKINILMIGLGTPKQEIWVKNNIEYIKKYKLLTLTQGGTFDFWAGNEKRAPKIFQVLKLEWFWRFITNPKKNFKKVLYSFYLFYFLVKGNK